MMTEEQEKALREFESVSDKVRRGGNHEAAYSAAYQRLVALKLRPQIRKRYR